jgi:hypothetical protein
VADPPLEVLPVVSGRSGRAGVMAAAVVGVGIVSVILAGRFGSQAPLRPPPPSVVAPSPAIAQPMIATDRPSPSEPTAALTTPVPRPSRLVPFRVPASVGSPETYVSPNLGFAVPLMLGPPSGYWDEGGPPSDAGGMLTFEVPAESSAAGNGAIRVVVGSERDPAPVRVPSDVGPVTPLWAPNLVTLVQQYAALLDGEFGRQTQLTLDGEQAHLFERPRGAAAVLLAVHHGRIYVLASLSATLGRGSSRRAFTTFIAAFRFVDATATP